MWLRSSRFSHGCSGASPPRRFPLSHPFAVSPPARLDYHLVHTVIPEGPPFRNSLGVFLNRCERRPSLFCSGGFKQHRPHAFGQNVMGLHLLSSHAPLKAGYTAPDARRTQESASHRVQVHPSSRYAVTRLRPWVSAEPGSTPTCPCRSPRFLNPQQQPPTGRRRPPPGTSSMCPQRIFRPVFERVDLTRILHHLCVWSHYNMAIARNPMQGPRSHARRTATNWASSRKIRALSPNGASAL